MNTIFLLFILTFTLKNAGAQVEPPCSSEIYCTGSLLRAVQMAKLYPDSKTFVDMSIREGNTPLSVLEAFSGLNNPSKEVLKDFVTTYFEEGNEFESWNPLDWKPNPKVLEKIVDPKLHSWASKLNEFWNELGRKIKAEVKEEPERFSMIYVSNGIIVPGGRFREFYYWDSYWIQIGLLHSEMNTTVRGMIDNFLEMVENDKYGFVPNGGRVYYRRSQPPLLIPMVKNYIEYINLNGRKEYLSGVLPVLEKEFMFWMDNRMVSVVDENNNAHLLAIYNSTKNEPRPESFREDYELGHALPEEEKLQMYTDLHSGAESGWDFSSRWWSVPPGETGKLAHTRTTNVIPADLNAILYLNAVLLSQFYTQVGETGKAEAFRNHAENLQQAIMAILWDEKRGSWFDYDIEHGALRREFYISNMIPLWAGVNDTKVDRIINYMQVSGALKYAGGIPTSLKQTGEQWDFPNGWAPLQHLVVDTFARFDSREAQDLAFDLAKKWTLGNYKYYEKKEAMLEKYDVTAPGSAGGGGEYEVVIGFGWTNGVVLDFLSRYGDKLRVPLTGSDAPRLSLSSAVIITMGTISILISSKWSL